jgi:hypothetical protein
VNSIYTKRGRSQLGAALFFIRIIFLITEKTHAYMQKWFRIMCRIYL